jgi:hypothetical protein
MIKIILIALMSILFLNGCTTNGQKIKSALATKYKVCQAEVDKLDDTGRYSNEQIIFIGIYAAQCNNTQQILEAIKKCKG